MTGKIQESSVEVCRGAVAEHAVARIIHVTSSLQLTTGITNHDERPFPRRLWCASAPSERYTITVLSSIAVAFRDGFQPFAELGDLFKVKPANEMIHAGCVHAVLATTVAGVVFTPGEAEAFEANIKVANTGCGG